MIYGVEIIMELLQILKIKITVEKNLQNFYRVDLTGLSKC